MTPPATSSMRATKERRIEMRLTAEQDELISTAAELSSVSKTAFIMNAAAHEAHEVLQRIQLFPISGPAFDDLLQDLDRPAEVVPELADLFKRLM